MARPLADSIDIPMVDTPVRFSTVDEEILTITIKATTTNTGDIYIGSIDVDAAVGFALAPGQALSLDPSQAVQDSGIPQSMKLSDIYADTATAGNDVEYFAMVT